MNGGTARFVGYRLRATWRRRWSGYLSVVLLVGSIGGVALASAAAARRTESAFPTFLASTNPSNLWVVPAPQNPAQNYSPAVTAQIKALPHVTHVATGVFISPYLMEPSGAPNASGFQAGTNATFGEISGFDVTQDRPAVIAGRLANPANPREIVMTPDAARISHVHVGSVLPLGFYTLAQQTAKSFGSPAGKPYLRLEAKVVGIVQLNTTLVQDDIDRTAWILFTPALTHELLTSPLLSGVGWTVYGLKLDHGDASVPAVERDEAAAAAKGTYLLYHDFATVTAQAQHAIAPEVLALWVFALIAALALVLVALQAISRLLHEASSDREVIRALGASPRSVVAESTAGTLVALGVGTALAVAVAFLLSPLAPLGPTRAVLPGRGFAFDAEALGLGAVGILVVTALILVVLATRATSWRRVRRAAPSVTGWSATARAVSAIGLAVPAVEGVRFALVPGRGRTAVPVRSVVAGATLAVVLLVSTLTFGSSLHTLVERPALYGWNYSYLLNSNFGIGDTPPATAMTLTNDRDVAAWSRATFVNIALDGQTVPTMFEPSRAPVAPPLLSGHAVDAISQIVLGPATLAALHTHVGGTVSGSYAGHHFTLHVVGTATFPSVGLNLTLHPSLGVGAVASTALFGNALNNGPYCGTSTQLIFVRDRPGVTAAAARADAGRVAAQANQIFAHAAPGSECQGDGFVVLGVQRPAEIVNYKTMGSTPSLLGGALAAGALAALGVTLVASVRRRRRDLAILRSLGFTRRQLSAVVAWQASVTMGVGVVVGVPVGILLGRWLWTLFARTIYVVPQPTVPWTTVVLVAAGALIFANVVAAIPGRLAAATETAIVLRVE